MVAIHLPMLLPRRRRRIHLARRVVAVSSSVGVAVISSVTATVLVMPLRALKGRLLRYRIADAAHDVIGVGLRRSIQAARRVRHKLAR